MKNTSTTHLDADQIVKKKFDETHDADRVYLVGGEKIELIVDSDKIGREIGNILGEQVVEFQKNSNQQLSTQLQSVEKNIFIPQVEIKTIEVPTIVKEIEYREIEKQVYIPQIEYKIVEIPVITEKIITVDRIVTVDKPIVIEKLKEVPRWQMICIIIQTVAVIGLFISHLTK